MLVSQIAAKINGKLIGGDFRVQGVCSLQNPKPFCIGFLNDDKSDFGINTEVANVALVVRTGYGGNFVGPRVLVDQTPRTAFAHVMQLLFPETFESRIHSTAIVHPTAKVGRHCNIGAYSIIEEDVIIGEGVNLGHHVVLGRGTRIGNSVRVSSNTVIGTTGFGFVADSTTSNRQVRIPHIGGVRIEDHVEIGSCVVIARGTIDDTVIGPHVKIDDHVFIAHNASIGENSVVIAGTEISGSVLVENDCWISPQVTITNGVTVGAGSLIGIGTVVIRDVPEETIVVGNPGRILRHRTPRA